ANRGLPMDFIGLLLGSGVLGQTLTSLGIWIFVFAVLFQVVTLPVELDASHRALRMLGDYGILGSDEKQMARSVLFAAAMTYVAAAVSSVLQLLRLLALANRRRN
ncbi:MAG: zinc metallopeptidase, partial [Lachnospiraceae bacterium]|nr:zinc metallopeptidase [Lachnospiraceae bacterium]